jgi:hypothetical protein
MLPGFQFSSRCDPRICQSSVSRIHEREKIFPSLAADFDFSRKKADLNFRRLSLIENGGTSRGEI